MWYEHVWQGVKQHLTFTVPAVVLVFAATWVLMLAVQNGAVGAAWVQAFGSIGAILAAAYIASEGRRVDRDRERRKETVVSLALLHQVEEAKSFLITESIIIRDIIAAHGEIKKPVVERTATLLNGQREKLRRIEMSALPDPRLVHALFEVICELEDARWIAEAVDLADFAGRGQLYGPFEENIAKVEDCIEVIRVFADL